MRIIRRCRRPVGEVSGCRSDSLFHAMGRCSLEERSVCSSFKAAECSRAVMTDAYRLYILHAVAGLFTAKIAAKTSTAALVARAAGLSSVSHVPSDRIQQESCYRTPRETNADYAVYPSDWMRKFN